MNVNNMYIEEEKYVIIDLIKNNNINELEKYVKTNHIKLGELNNDNFDILIFSIENTNSKDIINFIINQCHYHSLNYTFIDKGKLNIRKTVERKNYIQLKVPLFYSIGLGHFKISDLLIKKSDINYLMNDFDGNSINIIQYLCFTGKLNIINLNYILNSGFNVNNITDTLINTLINYKNGRALDLVECIFKFYILDNAFILNLLYCSKNSIALTRIQLQNIYNNKRKEIEFSDIIYSNALNEENYEALKLLLNYDGDEQKKLLNKVKKYKLLEVAIEENDYDFIQKIFSLKSFDFKYTDIERILIKTCRICDSDIINIIVEKLKCTNYNLNAIDFERVLLEASHFNNYNYYYNNIILEFLIEKLLNVTPNNFKDIDISLIRDKSTSYLSLLLNVIIKIGNLQLIQSLMAHPELEHLFNVNAKADNGEFPIITAYYAASNYSTENNAVAPFTNSIKIFEYLLSQGADCNEKDRDGNSLFLLAIQNKKYELAKCLLKYSIKINKKDANEIYPISLIEGIYQNNIDFIKFQTKIPQRNKNFNSTVFIKTNKFYFSPIIFAYLLNHQEIFKILLNHFNINELDNNGYTILHYAILKEDTETVKYLINMGANLNFQKNNFGHGNSALDIAIHIRNKEILTILLSHENVHLLLNTPNEYGEIPLMTIIECNNYTEDEKQFIIEKLIKKGSNINFIDRRKNTPLIYAIQEKSVFLTKLLIQYGASINLINKNGNSPLQCAIKNKLLDIIELLKDNISIHNQER